MDFNKYYLEQARGNFPVYRGAAFQKGYGLGGFFKRFFSWAIPLLKEHAVPIAKNIGKEVINNISNLAVETIDGKDFEENAKHKFKNIIEKVSQSGKGYKRRRELKPLRKNKKSKKKTTRFLDIFENKH